MTDRNAAHVTRPRPPADESSNQVITDADIELEILALRNGRIYVQSGRDENGNPLLTHEQCTAYVAHILQLMQAKK